MRLMVELPLSFPGPRGEGLLTLRINIDNPSQ